MAQRDSQLVIRARDEASKALGAISKALTDFVSAQTETAKQSGTTSGTLAKLGQSLAELGRSTNALSGVGKIAAQLERGQQAVVGLEGKLAQASAEFTEFQARATQASEAATALAAKSEAAAAAEKAQGAIVKGLGEQHSKNAKEIRDEERALQRLIDRMAKLGPTRPTTMVESAQRQRTAINVQLDDQTNLKARLDAERATLERLTEARKADGKALADAERERGKFANSVKTAEGNVENLTEGLTRSKGALAEIQTTFEAGAKAAGLTSASLEALAEKQEHLKAATVAATAVIEAQTKAEGASAAAARALAFQAALKTAAPIAPPAEVEPVVRARGVLAREADRQRAATEGAAAADAREKVQLDALGRSIDNVARSRARATPGVTYSPAAGAGATPGGLPSPGVGVVAVTTTAAATAALYREQLRAVETAGETFKTAQARLTELHREMAATGATVEQTAAINAQRVVVEAAEAAQKRETKQLEAFQLAVRAASAARRELAQAGTEAQRAQLAANVAGTQPRPGPLGEARVAALAPAAVPIGSAAAATEAYRKQIKAVDDTRDAYARAQVTLQRTENTLTDLYRTQATAQTPVAGLTEAIKEQIAAIDRQRQATDAAEAATKREKTALDALRESLRAASAARRAVPPPAPVQLGTPAETAARAAAVASRPTSFPAQLPPESSETLPPFSKGPPKVTAAIGADLAGTAAAYQSQVRHTADLAREFLEAKAKLQSLNEEQRTGVAATAAASSAIATQRKEVDFLQGVLSKASAALVALRSAMLEAARSQRQAPLTATVEGPGPAAQASAAFQAQVKATADASAAFADAKAKLEALYKAMSAVKEPTTQQTAALAAQRAEWEAAREAMQRENAALLTMRSAIAENINLRKQQAAAEIEATKASADASRRASVAAADAATAGRAAAARAEERAQTTLLGRVLQNVAETRRAYNASLVEETGQHNALISNLKNLAGAYLTVFTVIQAFKGAVTTAADAEAAQVRIATALGGTVEQGAIAYSHAANAARALRLDILKTVDGYGQFLAVVKGTSLEGAPAQKVFDDLLVTMRAFKLAPENLERVNIALRDMISRGNISKRELTQLDQALPVGSLQAMAQAAGYSTGRMADFNKAIRDGKVSIDILVPAFDLIAERARKNLPESLTTAQAAFADFKNAVFDFTISITSGQFMTGVVDGINAMAKVLRDPGASDGLRAIANGFGRLLSGVAAITPYVRELFVVISALATVKFVSMIASFQSIWLGLVAIRAVAVQVGAAFAGIATTGAIGAIEKSLVSIGTLLWGPVGIAVGVALAAGVLATWLTATKSAEQGLESYHATLDRIKDAIKETGGDLNRLGESKAPGKLQLTEIEEQVRAQREAYSAAGADIASQTKKIKDTRDFLATGFGGDKFLIAELDQINALTKEFVAGKIPILEFRDRVEDLNKTLTNESAKALAAELSKIAEKGKDSATSLSLTADTAKRMGSTMSDLEFDIRRDAHAFTDMRDGILKTDDALKEGMRALDAYGEAMDRLADKIPHLKDKLDLKKSLADIQADLKASISAIGTEYQTGVISAQKAVADVQAAKDRASEAEAAARDKAFLKTKGTPEQISESREFLLGQRETSVSREAVEGIHPDLSVGIADALKELQAKGITLKVEGGLKPGGTDATPAVESAAALIKEFEGFISTAKIDSDGKYRTGYGSDTTTDVSGRSHPVTRDTTTTEEDAQRDLARRVVEFQAGAAKDIGVAWGSLADNVKASITSVAYNYGHVPSSVVAAAKTGDNITISEAIAALQANPGRRAQEAANVTAVPGSALGAAAPTIQNFGGGVQLSGITDANAQQVADALAKHNVYVPHGDNVAQLGSQKLEDNPGLLAALQQAKRAGDTTAMFQTLSGPGEAKKAADSANADRSREANDRIKLNEAAEKGVQTAKEELDVEQARDSVVKGMADYRAAHPGASQDDLITEEKRLRVAQSQAEVEAEVQKYKDQHPPASQDKEDVDIRNQEVEAYRKLREQIHAERLERDLDNLAAKDSKHVAADEMTQLNALVVERNRLLKEKSFATETGDETKLDAVNSKLDENKNKIQEVTAELRKYFETLGGSAGAAGLATLDKISAGFDAAHTKVQIFGLSVNQTRELANDFVSDVTGGIDTFAQEIADGVKPIQALGDAFRKFASDFLKQIAEMIIKAQLFKLLGLTESGSASGGGLLGGLSGATSAAGSSGGGVSSIFGFLGSLFGAHHTGGVVGSPTMFRNVSPLVFEGAARYHTGGVAGLGPDEIPIIAKRNEEILTDNDPRHRDNQQNMAINNIVKQPKILNLWSVEDLMSAALNTPDGERAIINYIRNNAGAVKGAIGG